MSVPVPFGHIPYGISLPSCMGPFWDFGSEWWYYAGWAYDREGNPYTLLVEILRVTLGDRPASTASTSFFGIGGSDPSSFSSSYSLGFGLGPHGSLQIAPVSSESYSISQKPLVGSTTTDFKLESGKLGFPGAVYSIQLTSSNLLVSIRVKDRFGMILEGASGAIGTTSYEFAMPVLTILAGSTLSFFKAESWETVELISGNLWLDRQTTKPRGSNPSHPLTLAEVTLPPVKSLTGMRQWLRLNGKALVSPRTELYVGNWLGLVMNDGAVYAIVFFWPSKAKQWQVGTRLGVPPTNKTCLAYPPVLSVEPPKRDNPTQGVRVLDSFDLNIYDARHPDASPHWTSPKSGQTYCTKWLLEIGKEVYILTLINEGAEVNLAGSAFGEGAATLHNQDGSLAGHAFVEQMGYN
jgi:hypothetical protein